MFKIEELQDELLSIYKDIDSIADQNNINLYLGGGSLLGAVRHKGFIPWDDDIDLMIFRKDIEKFTTLLNNHPNYEVNNVYNKEYFPHTFIKIEKKNTLLIESAKINFPYKSGIFIDLFILENVPNNKIKRKFHGSISRIVNKLAMVTYDDKYLAFGTDFYNTPTRKIRKLVTNILNGFTTPTTWVKMAEKWDSIYKNKDCANVTVPNGRAGYFGEIMNKKDYDNTIMIEFEDHKGKTIENYETYLTNLYGSNYMVVPDVKDRETHGIVKFEK